MIRATPPFTVTIPKLVAILAGLAVLTGFFWQYVNQYNTREQQPAVTQQIAQQIAPQITAANSTLAPPNGQTKVTIENVPVNNLTSQQTVKSEILLYNEETVSAEQYDEAFYQQHADQIQIDHYGNYLVALKTEDSNVVRFLVSNQSLYYPSIAERDQSNVEGCMSLNYYVTYKAAVTLLVIDKGNVRDYHSVCEYDSVHHQYQLIRYDTPNDAVTPSIHHLITSQSPTHSLASPQSPNR